MTWNLFSFPYKRVVFTVAFSNTCLREAVWITCATSFCVAQDENRLCGRSLLPNTRTCYRVGLRWEVITWLWGWILSSCIRCGVSFMKKKYINILMHSTLHVKCDEWIKFKTTGMLFLQQKCHSVLKVSWLAEIVCLLCKKCYVWG
jgi:hypothetical protein